MTAPVATIRSLLDPGDEVLVPAPDYPLWTACTTLSGGTPNRSRTSSEMASGTAPGRRVGWFHYSGAATSLTGTSSRSPLRRSFTSTNPSASRLPSSSGVLDFGSVDIAR